KLSLIASRCFEFGWCSATPTPQPLGAPAAGRMSNRCIMPRSSWSMTWQCATKQPTVTGLKYTRNVIDPGVALLMLLGGPAQVSVGSAGKAVLGLGPGAAGSTPAGPPRLRWRDADGEGAGEQGALAAGTSKVSCHSGSGRVTPFIFVIST